MKQEPKSKSKTEPKVLQRRGPKPELYRGRRMTKYEMQWICIARTNPFYRHWTREQLLDMLHREI